MNDGNSPRLGDPHEFKLLEDLGRWVRESEAKAERDEPAFERFPAHRVDALIDRVLQVQEQGPPPTVAATVPIEPQPANGRGRWLSSVAYFTVAAAAVVATFFVVVPRPGSRRAATVADGSSELSSGLWSGRSSELGSEPGVAKDTRPAFASVRIDGGGPPPEHQGAGLVENGKPHDAQLVCLGRPLQLALAVTKGQHVDPSVPLEITLEATPPWGSSHRFVYDVGHDDRFAWVDDGQALVFSGTLEQLAPLSPGRWTLQISAGTPGTCSLHQDRSACFSTKVRTIEVIEHNHCDVRR